MRFRFTTHAKQKIIRIQQVGFLVSRQKVKQTILTPLRIENRPDNTQIASSLLDETHILRVVYRKKNDIIAIITCYPGRRKAYDL